MGAPRKRPGRSAKELAQDDLVMATNSSSIVSKRSVERIYYPDEPHFFRFFVNKFQRRSPLINRGYHFRLHVIDVSVRRFLQRPSDKTKVVVNLGCGSDVLPWQCMTRYKDHCAGVKFVDIDFPDLIRKKTAIVQGTPELLSPLSGVCESGHDDIPLQSEQYVQIGCDLRDLARIESALSRVVNIPDCEFLFVAEVSITYMETEGADAVIRWASTLGQTEFCLLEQILPDGPNHPFAKTMLRHFDKLKTQLKSVFAYPTLASQATRFHRLGWSHANVQSLWQLWSHDDWISAQQRADLDQVEPFDEWEEFALFASHYCVVSARNGYADAPVPAPKPNNDLPTVAHDSMPVRFSPYRSTQGQRRFGAAISLSNEFGDSLAANAYGLGPNSRLRSHDLYSPNPHVDHVRTAKTGPPSRMCQTMTDLGPYGRLLVGGRTSPSTGLKDSWILEAASNTWCRIDDIPYPLYRHAATQLGRSRIALVLGGRTSASTIFEGCLILRPETGWTECRITPGTWQPTFGHILQSFDEVHHCVDQEGVSDGSVRYRGFLVGGIDATGVVTRQTLLWNLLIPVDGPPVITFSPLTARLTDGPEGNYEARHASAALLNRFGASILPVGPKKYALVGGVIGDSLLDETREVLTFQVTGSQALIRGMKNDYGAADTDIPRPLLVGMSCVLTNDNHIVVMGGGGTCFSMGTYWNQGCYTLSTDASSAESDNSEKAAWAFLRATDITGGDASASQLPSQARQSTTKTAIPRVKVGSRADFDKIVRASKPVVIEGCDLGGCTSLWTGDYLAEKVGVERQVVVHEAASPQMDFNAKNFSYVTKSFSDLVRQIEAGKKLYLRALSDERPTDRPADLQTDYPSLADDFRLPDELALARDNAFSSVLRLSGPVNMWLHYDVMANLYCQVSGAKRMVLFPPSDVTHLSFAPGASSSSLDVFRALAASTLPPSTRPHEALLKPGDVLYLPPLWLHAGEPHVPQQHQRHQQQPETASDANTTAAAAAGSLGVAVNVFFRSLDDPAYAPGRDVYGNRDLAAYEKGRQDVARLAAAFNTAAVPADAREFYLRRLADELAGKAGE